MSNGLRRKLLFIVSFLVILILITGCSASKPVTQDSSSKPVTTDTPTKPEPKNDALKPTKLVFAHGFAPNQTWAKAAVKFKEVAEQKTNGLLTIEIYDNSQLGEQRKLFEDIMTSGTNDLTITLEPISMWVPEINLYQLLYLFRDKDHLIKFEEGSVGQELKELVREKTGVRTLAYFAREGRELTRNKPINSIEDLKGLKVRVTESKAAIKGWEALGAKPVPMAWGEVFTAIQQGVIDGQENPFDHVLARKTYEVTKYGARTNHVYASVWLMISDKKYNSLPKEWQTIINEAALEAQKYERSLAAQEAAAAEASLQEKGFTITEPDLAPFLKAAETSHKEFPELKTWIDKIKAIQ